MADFAAHLRDQVMSSGTGALTEQSQIIDPEIEARCPSRRYEIDAPCPRGRIREFV
jgi:hypothetical protein